MKKFLYILILSFLTILSVSCKKQPKLHKIKYQITFLEIPHWASSNYLEVQAYPAYQNEYNYDTDAPYITYNQTQDGLWEYEYWELKDGDDVYLFLWAQLDYHFELRVFIDDVEVSYKRIKISDSNYFSAIEIDEEGLDDTPGDQSIEFTYHE
jgi:hypothetical protein